MFWNPKTFGPKLFLSPRILFGPKNFFVLENYFCTQNFLLYPNFFGPKFLFNQQFFGLKIFLDSKFFKTQIFLTQKDLVWFYAINLPNQNLLNQRLSKLNTLDLSLVLALKPKMLGEPSKPKMSQIVEKVEKSTP